MPLTATAATCTCAQPIVFMRPSGQAICLNGVCGLPIAPTPAPKDRP